MSENTEANPEESDSESQKEDLELPLFDYSTISNATDNFSTKNKLGEGGFGPVYKVTIHISRHADYMKILTFDRYSCYSILATSSAYVPIAFSYTS